MILGEKVNMALKILVCNNRRDSSKMNRAENRWKKKRRFLNLLSYIKTRIARIFFCSMIKTNFWGDSWNKNQTWLHWKIFQYSTTTTHAHTHTYIIHIYTRMYIRKKNERSRLRDLILKKNLCESRVQNSNWINTGRTCLLLSSLLSYVTAYINGNKRRSAKTFEELNEKEIHSES